MAEKNLIGELDMYREAGIKPNFSDIAKRYGKDRGSVEKVGVRALAAPVSDIRNQLIS